MFAYRYGIERYQSRKKPLRNPIMTQAETFFNGSGDFITAWYCSQIGHWAVLSSTRPSMPNNWSLRQVNGKCRAFRPNPHCPCLLVPICSQRLSFRVRGHYARSYSLSASNGPAHGSVCKLHFAGSSIMNDCIRGGTDGSGAPMHLVVLPDRVKRENDYSTKPWPPLKPCVTV